MLLARRLTTAATALSLIAGGLVVVLFAATQSPAQAAFDTCGETGLTVLPSPVAPWKGAPLRVMVVSEKPVEGVLSLIAPDGSVAARSADRHGASPYSWFAEVGDAGRRDVARDAGAGRSSSAMRARYRRQRAEAGAGAHAPGQLLAGAQ